MKKSISALIIAEAANPEWTSVPLVGWSHAQALANEINVHVVTQVRNRDAILRAGWKEGEQFTAIDSEPIARPMHRIARRILPKGKAWTAGLAIGVPAYYFFERLLWNRFEARLRQGEFDVVHRLTPLSPTIPSLIAAKCARIGVPFVWGPINGGVPWPKGFDAVRRQEAEWLSYVREGYKLLPGYRSTRRHAAAIIAGSRDTYRQLAPWCRDKAVYIPENGIDPTRFNRSIDRPPNSPLRVAFVGRLVPYKGADMLIEAAAPLAAQGKLRLELFGDGPEMPRLRKLVENSGAGESIRLHGWVEHKTLQERLVECDIFGFPSIREFGGGAVLEAMALGLVPVIADYAGPAELVTPETGYKVPLGNRSHLIEGFRHRLAMLATAPEGLAVLSRNARERAFTCFTWQAKARQVIQVYSWVLGRGPKPDYGMPLVRPL